nr:hypothetical protein [uncultured Rhodopila sp.]
MLDLEHYLDVLSHKPGAFAGSKPLAQWSAAGRWPACYDELWERLRAAVVSMLSHGACDVAAVRYLLTEASLHKGRPAPIDVGALARYDRPLPDLADYDTLLSAPCAGNA